MRIQIVQVTVSTTPTAKGSYQTAEVVYKNITYQGKVESKKVMSFGAGKDSFGVLSAATSGEQYDVNVVKNDKGYNDWVSVTRSTGEEQQQTQGTVAPGRSTGSAQPAARTSTYETPEERAKKQVYIIKQSALGYAVGTLTPVLAGLPATPVTK